MDRNDPLRNFRFRVEINGITQAGFSDVAIAETTVDVVDYREGTDAPHFRKLSGLTKYGNVTLKRGMTAGTGALDLLKWHDTISKGFIKENRKDVTVIVYDEAGQQQAARFVISAAWPTKYHHTDFTGKGNEVIIELLELANEGIERTN
ncbi:MAG TPA: phage tail protein [Gemmatimonadaceae bacterium]|jgi:phage tail-like protein|nr:phage tail protein [Gemmatimonadaceae bacterium]HWJ12158.1 phage tail protein [Gemmatimonadaceae bacterium]